MSPARTVWRPAWLVVSDDSRASIDGHARGERIPLTDGAQLGSQKNGALVVPHASIAPRQARFKTYGGAWHVDDLAGEQAIWVNGVRADNSAPLAHGDEIRVGELDLRFAHDAELARFAGVRRAGAWTLFNSLGRGLRHAIHDDGTIATACVAPYRPLRVPGAPAVIAELPEHRALVLEEIAGTSAFWLGEHLRRRGDPIDPTVVCAWALALARCAGCEPLPDVGASWLTYDGRVVLVGWPLEYVTPLVWRAHVAGIALAELAQRWQPNVRAPEGDELRTASAFARDGVRDGPLAPQMRAVFDVGARADPDPHALVPALEALQEAAGGAPSREYLASLLADVFPAETKRERELREEALALGAVAMAKLAPT